MASSLPASVCRATFGELTEDSSEDSKREACCLGDAVFSRTANWGEWDFIFATQSFSERLLERIRDSECLWPGVRLPTV